MNALVATEAAESPQVTLHSELFGPMSVPEIQVFTFPDGLYGFPDAHRFVLIPAERPGVYWLQSVEFSALTFLLADPFEWAQDYSVELADDEMGSLAPADPSDLAVLGIITLPARPDELPTMNLQGPLAFNVRKRTGRQLVLQDDEYGVRFPVDLQGTQGAG